MSHCPLGADLTPSWHRCLLTTRSVPPVPAPAWNKLPRCLFLGFSSLFHLFIHSETAARSSARRSQPGRIVHVVLGGGDFKPFSFPGTDTKGEARGEGGSPEYEDFFMPSLRAVTWEQGRGRAGCAVPGEPRSFCRQGRGGDAHGATASVPGCGRGAAQRCRLWLAHTFRSLAHTGAGCSKSPGTGRGRAGAQPPPPLHLYPRGTQTIPGARPRRLPAPQNPGAIRRRSEGNGWNFTPPARRTPWI